MDARHWPIGQIVEPVASAQVLPARPESSVLDRRDDVLGRLRHDSLKHRLDAFDEGADLVEVYLHR